MNARARRRHLDASVVARASKFGMFVKKHLSHEVDVVAQADTLLLGCRRLWSPDNAYMRPQELSPAPVPSAPELPRV